MTYTIDLSGKTAVVTGGSGVLGSAMCQGLAQAGAAVAVLGTTPGKIDAVVTSIQQSGGKAIGVVVDVLDRASIERAAQQITTELGSVDILVNCAGGNKPEATTTPDKARNFFDLPEDALQWVFNLNYLGSILPSQVFGKTMTENGAGVIINISSMSAMRPLTRVLAYGGAKSAVDNFTQWLAVHFAQEYSPNIRVNAIAPGFFLTDQNRFLLTDQATGDLTQRGQQIISHTPMNRFGDAEDLVGTLLWLVSDAARFVTGVVVPVDGGFSAYSGV
ncbi:MAG: SDR family oxidoreductase [Anaerolineae bacterium]|nr:SDR family oxidoreductase [Anaerolineae bacterium]